MKQQRTEAEIEKRDRRRRRRRRKLDPKVIPELGNRRRSAGRREADDFWGKVRLPRRRRAKTAA